MLLPARLDVVVEARGPGPDRAVTVTRREAAGGQEGQATARAAAGKGRKSA
jgi:hypothetical protein